MKAKMSSWPRVVSMAYFTVCVTLVSSPAFAGYSSGAPQKLVQAGEGVLKPFVDLFTSPLLGMFAGLMMMMAVGTAFLAPVSEAIKGALKIAAVICLILMTPSFITAIVDGAGAVI